MKTRNPIDSSTHALRSASVQSVLADKAAITMSLICAIHCLAFPLAIVLLPSLAALPLAGEAFHRWMLVAVIPTSVFALTIGCRKHQRYRVLSLGILGLALMITAVLLGEHRLGELMEKSLTLSGAGVITFGHVANFRLCRELGGCHSEEHEAHE